MCDATGVAEAMLGLPGFRVLDVRESAAEVIIEIEMLAELVGCPRCGVVARAHELAPEVPLYRISLATLLDHAGCREEACELIRDLDLNAVSCRGCLRRMSTIFLSVGEDRQAEACRTRSEETP